MANEFYSGMKGPEAILKLNELWDMGAGAGGDSTSAAASAAAAAASEAAAAASASSASSSATSASNSASSAASSLASINVIFDNFDDRYLGAKATDPTVDNDGNAILVGAIYYNTAISKIKFYNGTTWDTPELTATNAANSATASASAAATSASAAATSATNASNSASSASTSATNASNSASSASTSATNASNSASAAATSATNAAESANLSFNSAGSAQTSATNAQTSAINAANSATNAQASATSAQTSATAASVSAQQASDTLDQFDDRYLGSKTNDPSVDNDGNALLVGALYWNSTAQAMRVWTGSTWLAAYLPSTSYVSGPASSTDNTIAVFDGTSGKVIKASSLTISPGSSGSIVTFGDVDSANTANKIVQRDTNGDFAAGTITAINFNSTSDQRLKTNISSISGVQLVNKINAVKFDWKDSGQTSYGVLAQELEKILPELVSTDSNDNKTVNYIPLIAVLISAVQELSSRLDSK